MTLPDHTPSERTTWPSENPRVISASIPHGAQQSRGTSQSHTPPRYIGEVLVDAHPHCCSRLSCYFGITSCPRFGDERKGFVSVDGAAVPSQFVCMYALSIQDICHAISPGMEHGSKAYRIAIGHANCLRTRRACCHKTVQIYVALHPLNFLHLLFDALYVSQCYERMSLSTIG